ncbi:MAG: glycine cleavage system protein GcvH [Methanobacteriota archaeon]|nr:MAG: glycine cleavage system protein GcvH [Euryarchaeota archaeon]
MSEMIMVDDYAIATDRMYLKTHEWVKQVDEKTFLIGISDYAQKMLHEITYVQFEDVGEEFQKEEVILVVEALKASGDIYAPFDLKLVEVNEILEDEPEKINQSPYEEGWLAKVEALSDDRSSLISPEEYAEVVKKELEEA